MAEILFKNAVILRIEISEGLRFLLEKTRVCDWRNLGSSIKRAEN